MSRQNTIFWSNGKMRVGKQVLIHMYISTRPHTFSVLTIIITENIRNCKQQIYNGMYVCTFGIMAYF